MLDISEYKALFVSEAQEHLQAIHQALLALERMPSDQKALETIFRSAHTLKGMAGTMGYQHLTDFAHAVEDLLDRMRRKKLRPTSTLFELLFESVDTLDELLNEIVEDRKSQVDVRAWVERMQMFASEAEKRSLHQDAGPVRAPAVEGGLQRVQVILHADSPMKGARAFAILKRLRQSSTVMGCSPAEELLAEGNYGNEFRVFLTSSKPASDVENAIRAMPDVADVVVSSLG